jgi:hypothetical protein
MPTRPAAMRAVVQCVAPLCSSRVWRPAPGLLVGAVLAPRAAHRGRRPARDRPRPGVAVAPLPPRAPPRRVVRTGRGPGAGGGLAAAGAPTGPLLAGSDEPLERRRPGVHDRGQRIAATGICRAPVRASRGPCVTASKASAGAGSA